MSKMSQVPASIKKNDWKTFKRIQEILNNKISSSSNKNAVTFNDAVVEMNNVNKRQMLNYFPNNAKHIDYVIYYKEIEDAEKQIESNRKKFFKKLELEQFDLYFLKQNDVKNSNVKHVFVLLNCSLERLMEEAERLNLELPLKQVSILIES